MARSASHFKEESFNFRVASDLKAAFQKAAEKEDRPAAQLIRDFMREYVNAHQEAEVGHDEWFGKQVRAALHVPSKTKKHQDVMKDIRHLLEKLDKDNNGNNMA